MWSLCLLRNRIQFQKTSMEVSRGTETNQISARRPEAALVFLFLCQTKMHAGEPCSSLSAESGSCIPDKIDNYRLKNSSFKICFHPPTPHLSFSPLWKKKKKKTLSRGRKWIIAGTWESFSDNIIIWGCVFPLADVICAQVKTRLEAGHVGQLCL